MIRSLKFPIPFTGKACTCHLSQMLAPEINFSLCLFQTLDPWAIGLLFWESLSKFVGQCCWQTQPGAMLSISPPPSGFCGTEKLAGKASGTHLFISWVSDYARSIGNEDVKATQAHWQMMDKKDIIDIIYCVYIHILIILVLLYYIHILYIHI